MRKTIKILKYNRLYLDDYMKNYHFKSLEICTNLKHKELSWVDCSWRINEDFKMIDMNDDGIIVRQYDGTLFT